MSIPSQQGILSIPSGTPTGAAKGALQRLGLGGSRDGLLFLPPSPALSPYPLIVLLHGAGGNATNTIGFLERKAAEHGCALLVPESREHTWDVIIGGFGPDIEFLDRALALVFSSCLIDTGRIAIAGFSDGASYALTLGLINGRIFTDVIAFSPGFMTPSRLEGRPRIFISHGLEDEVLPIARCSRRIVPQLQTLKYDLTYREFVGGHVVPDSIVDEAMHCFLNPDR